MFITKGNIIYSNMKDCAFKLWHANILPQYIKDICKYDVSLKYISLLTTVLRKLKYEDEQISVR
jgi:hypothetical protein